MVSITYLNIPTQLFTLKAIDLYWRLLFRSIDAGLQVKLSKVILIVNIIIKVKFVH